MNLTELKKELGLIQKQLKATDSGIRCYIFGSVLRQPKKSNDIDLLVIYPPDSSLQNIKAALHDLSCLYPLHILYLTSKEEQDLNFIDEQEAEFAFSIP